MKARVVVMTRMYDNEDKDKGKNIDSNYNTDTDITHDDNKTGVFSFFTQQHRHLYDDNGDNKTRAKTDLFMNAKKNDNNDDNDNNQQSKQR